MKTTSSFPPAQGVIYEGLRMRPPVPIKVYKVVPPEGDEIGGKFIPGGTAVGWNLLPMMRSPRHWGRDADVFRPERFADADPAARASRERLVEMAFGHGRFSCAGKPLAFMELNKVYFEVSPPWRCWLCCAPLPFDPPPILLPGVETVSGGPVALTEGDLQLFRYFDFQIVNPLRPWKSEFFSVWLDDDYLVQVTEAVAG